MLTRTRSDLMRTCWVGIRKKVTLAALSTQPLPCNELQSRRCCGLDQRQHIAHCGCAYAGVVGRAGGRRRRWKAGQPSRILGAASQGPACSSAATRQPPTHHWCSEFWTREHQWWPVALDKEVTSKYWQVFKVTLTAALTEIMLQHTNFQRSGDSLTDNSHTEMVIL